MWGAASEGPAAGATSRVVSGMILCPANGVDRFGVFNGNDGAYNPSEVAVYQETVQSYAITEPAIDLTATSFLMWVVENGSPSKFMDRRSMKRDI